MITVVDYGAGNLHSVENTLKFLGVAHRVTSLLEEVAQARAILLPGVGHFGQMMRSLAEMEMITTLRDAIRRGVPYLGICLGMHVLFEGSEEAPETEGLGIYPGRIRRFPADLPASYKVPHMGWNQIRIDPVSRLFAGIRNESYVYFAHSYYLPMEVMVERIGLKTGAPAFADYAFPFIAAIEKENVFGTQFHPEKSGDIGLKVVENFAAVCQPAEANGRPAGEIHAG
jgi:glutamine amidotransferase